MKKISITYSLFVTLAVLLEASNISASEPKTLVQDILTNSDNCWKDLHLLPSQLIGSMILRNHPIVSFIFNSIQVVTLKGHMRRISSAEFNRSGDLVITASRDKTAKLWEVRSGKCLQTLKGHTDWVKSAIFNGSGDRVLTASADLSVKLWETSSGKCLRTLTKYTTSIQPAKFSDSGDMVITTAFYDNTVKLWETSSGECLKTLEHDKDVNSAVFNSSGGLVLTASKDGTAKLWETSSGKCLQTLEHDKDVNSAEFNRSGDMLITASHDKTAKLWDTNSGECLKTLKGHLSYVWYGEFNNSGNIILTYAHDNIPKLWETRSGMCFHNLWHPRVVTSAAFIGSGDMILTTSVDRAAKLWETRTGKCLRTLTLKGHTGHLKFAKFNRSGDILVTLPQDETANLYDISQFLKLRSFFSRDDSISLNQAVVLIGIYEIIIYRRLLRKTVSSYKLYFRRLKDSLKDLSSSTEGQTLSSDRLVFDFRTCPHLQEDYEKLPRAVQKILDEYVRKAPSNNDCSTASTTDAKSVSSASTSEQL